MSTTALATLTRNLATRLNMGENDKELIATLKATAFRSEKMEVTDSQLTALMIVANQYGLNPWTKEIYAFPDKKNGIIPVVGVDGWSRIINENQQFDGMEFTSSEKMVRAQGAKADAPEWMECTIYRKDRTHPTVIREYLDEVYRDPFKGQYGDTIGPWQTHPKRFLRHKTMIQCSRIAFGYVGIFDKDEAERIAEVEINPLPSKPIRQTGAQVAEAAREQAQTGASEAITPAMRDNMILDLELVAKEQGAEAYVAAWAALSKPCRTAITLAERDRIMKIAESIPGEATESVDQETGEVSHD